MQLECWWGTPSSSTQNTVKNNFFDFLKVYNELGKVKKFRTSRPLFMEKQPSVKSVGSLCPARTNRVKANGSHFWEVRVVMSILSTLLIGKYKMTLKISQIEKLFILYIHFGRSQHAQLSSMIGVKAFTTSSTLIIFFLISFTIDKTFLMP